MSETAGHKTRVQFSLRGVLLATTVVAWTLAVNRWLGDVYGWRTAPACGIVAAFLLLVDRRTAIGCAVGSVTLALFGYLFVLDLYPLSRFFKAMLIFMAFGGAAGCSFHAILLDYRVRGSIALVVSIIGFLVILYIN